jgi:hypothetical protein
MPMHQLLSGVKKSVAFVFLLDDQDKVVPYGTGFFARIRQEHNPKRGVGYFVTAKHVLQDRNGNFLNNIIIRMNGLDGKANFTKLELNQTTIFTHEDKSVDVAVIPIRPNESIIDFNFIDGEIITNKQLIVDLGIGEGQEVFFTGLFSSYIGQQKNQPIIRFGKVALMPEEKIEYEIDNSVQLKDLYLIESFSFPGNSGSPVFFDVNKPDRQYRIYLAGLIMGSYHHTDFLSSNTILKQNVGIAAITPSYKLHDILFSDNVKEHRKNAPD